MLVYQPSSEESHDASTSLIASVFFVFSLMLLPSAPSLAVTPKEKMATCKFGADHPKLSAKARAEFIKKCMADKNDPRGPTHGTAAPGGPGPEGEQLSGTRRNSALAAASRPDFAGKPHSG